MGLWENYIIHQYKGQSTSMAISYIPFTLVNPNKQKRLQLINSVHKQKNQDETWKRNKHEVYIYENRGYK
ncbi:hypothetical protein AQUCO_02000483v1 [Aquilegia coerulea]|uniref:Uncharacterized protein n=1 Tax=Aquilegia coerulea TaxID=218851 RepID=A0A2G5DHQ2_AQUCA|nr:hypothetical protein AQUCO_02000483v1 [Aquilegia coerulea]